MSNDNLEQEVPATPESETVEVPVDDGAKSADLNSAYPGKRVITLTYGDMGFISDIMAGAKTPYALVSIGNFVGTFLDKIATYQEEANKLTSSHTEQYIALAKEFFVLDEQMNPTVDEETKKWKLIEGKTDEDTKDFGTRHNNMTAQFNDEKNKLANKSFSFEVDEYLLWNFKDAFLHNVDIQIAQRELTMKPGQPPNPQDAANFVAILYSVATKIRSL